MAATTPTALTALIQELRDTGAHVRHLARIAEAAELPREAIAILADATRLERMALNLARRVETDSEVEP